MANMKFVGENSLTVESAQQQQNSRKIILFLGFGIAVALLFVSPVLSAGALLLTGVSWLTASGNKVLDAGAMGEDLTVQELDRLPDSFTVFNQVNLPNAKSKTGFNEADIIVVGPHAVFAIEVKHNNGTISGDAAEKDWAVQKVGRGGTAYGKTMRNPVSQVKKLVWLLSEQFKKQKINAWIQGVVVFSNSECQLEVQNSNANVPVLRIEELTDYMYHYKGKRSAFDPAPSIEELIYLKKSVS